MPASAEPAFEPRGAETVHRYESLPFVARAA